MKTRTYLISVADVRKHRPCYDPIEIPGITENTEMTLLECMKYQAKKLTDTDKVWLATRFFTDTQNRTFAIWCARSCKTGIKEIKDFIDAIENYYIKKTITKEQLDAAYLAAARAADWAAYSAADWAAYSAADRVAKSADSETNRAEQVKQIINMIEEAGE